jgi:hypothetical protein
MSTERPRVQSYLDPELYQKLKEFQQEQGLKESAALNQILKEYFGIGDSSPVPIALSLPPEKIEKIVKDEVSQLFRCQLEDNVDFFINCLSQRVAMVEQSLERFVNSSDARIKELQGDLGERLAACEDSLEVLLSEPASAISNSLDLTRSPSSTARHENIEPSPETISRRVIEAIEGGKMQEVEGLSELPSELNLTQLARRLNISKSVVSNRKSRPDFEEWSRGKDPEGVAWQCRKQGQWIKFYPIEDNL